MAIGRSESQPCIYSYTTNLNRKVQLWSDLKLCVQLSWALREWLPKIYSLTRPKMSIDDALLDISMGYQFTMVGSLLVPFALNHHLFTKCF